MGYIGPREPALIDPGSIDNSELADVAQNTIKGRVASGNGEVQDLSSDQAISVINAGTTALDGARLNSYYRRIRVGGGADLTQRPRVNYISGSGISVSGADDAIDLESDITIGLAPIATGRVLGNISGAPEVPQLLDSDGLFSVLNGSGTAKLNNNRLAALTPDPTGTYDFATVTVDSQGRVTAASSNVITIAPGVITNTEIAAGAEIAVSKLADGAARQLLQTAANGTDVEWTSNVDLPGTLDVTGAAAFDGTVQIAGALTVNEGAADVDLRVEGTGATHLLFTDASTNRVGINQSDPAVTWDLAGAMAQNLVSVASLDIDCSAGNYFIKTIATNSTFTFSNVPASRVYSFTLEVTHTSGTISWPASVRWPSGIAPALSTGKTHLFVFVTRDGGTRWRGSALINYTT